MMRSITRLLGFPFSPTTRKMVLKTGLEKIRLGLVNQGLMVLDSKVGSTMQYEQTLGKKLRDNLMDFEVIFLTHTV